ncbi:hypothetical protein F3Y22_tig00109936pilonHSYRG00103 [Hibiscus syriacus]|uniref:Protein LAZY 1-like n=1 Tax=Hibiscus syriacus TaxID=106335 RepID=A0A6A3BS33_HIBSY|nr:hypothetical protein F3Y22_tig00109936pilonHSYRG00103 [Hibiscus syriacus]
MSGHSCNCLTGHSSVDDQQLYSKPNYGTKPFRPPQRNHLRKSFAGIEAARDEEDYEEDSSTAMSELFHGFLAIGTLVTQNELKLINDELEKVLGAEAKEEGCNDSSGRKSYVSTGRNSHVSMGRSSHGSTITLSGKPVEGPDTNGNGTTVCPLQDYLFGSAIELSETNTVAKKEHKTSLGELFQRTKITEENVGSKYDKEEKRTEKEGDKSAVHIMKKMLNKKMLNASRSSTAATGGNMDSASAETKLHKILHMFHKKVHPESSTTTSKHDKPQNIENKEGIFYDGGHENGDHMLADDDIMIYPQRSLSKNIWRYKSQSNPPQFTLSCNDSNGNRECWIKTDADRH